MVGSPGECAGGGVTIATLCAPSIWCWICNVSEQRLYFQLFQLTHPLVCSKLVAVSTSCGNEHCKANWEVLPFQCVCVKIIVPSLEDFARLPLGLIPLYLSLLQSRQVWLDQGILSSQKSTPALTTRGGSLICLWRYCFWATTSFDQEWRGGLSIKGSCRRWVQHMGLSCRSTEFEWIGGMHLCTHPWESSQVLIDFLGVFWFSCSILLWDWICQSLKAGTALWEAGSAMVHCSMSVCPAFAKQHLFSLLRNRKPWMTIAVPALSVSHIEALLGGIGGV